MSLEVVKKHSLPSTQSIWSVACRNKYVVTGDVEGKVKTWIQDDPYEMEKEWTVSDMSIISVASTGSIVIVSSMDSRITAWDIVSGEKIREIECGPVNNWAVAVNPVNPDLVATTGQSGHIHIWDIKSGARVQVLETQNSKFTMSVAWSPDGKWIACGSMDGVITIFNETGSRKHSIVAHTACVRTLSFSSDSRTLVSGSDDTFVHVYETGTAQLLRTLSGHASWVLSVAVCPNNKYIASGSNDKNVKIWDMATGECLSNLNKEHTEAAWSVAWNNTGTKLFSAGDSQLVMYQSLDK